MRCERLSLAFGLAPGSFLASTPYMVGTTKTFHANATPAGPGDIFELLNGDRGVRIPQAGS